MSIRIFVGAAAVAVLAAGGWYALRPPELAPLQSNPPEKQAGKASASSGVASMGALPSSPAAPVTRTVAPVRVMPTAPPPSVFAQLLNSKEYRIFYDRLLNSPEGSTAEGKLAMYELLRECATITGGARPGYKRPTPNREQFVNSIVASDPDRERRIAAYDAFTENRCRGMEGVNITQADLLRILDEAAAAGSAAARALRIENEMMYRAGNVRRELTDTQVGALQAAASSRDPEAIRVAGRVMANSWPNYSLRLGPDQQPIDQRAFVHAFLVLACEYGAPCGQDTARLQEACAMRGHCNAQNYPDYLHYYLSTPNESTLLSNYRGIIQHAIESGNWSQLSVVRNGPGTHRGSFIPGPR